MLQELLITPRLNEKIDPILEIWTWEISFYLFLGGLTAGIIVFAALAQLRQREGQRSFSADALALWAPIALSLGMTTLFLDLEHKLFVFRFYTTFQPTSPMSWGAWVLIIIYPVTILQILSTLRQGYPKAAGLVDRFAIGRWVLDLANRYKRPIAIVAIPSAVALGIYTGILLSAFNARPFWNSGLLGVLFLVSGLSTAAAFVILMAKDKAEKHFYVLADLGLILVELVLVVLLLINLATGSQQHLQALAYLTSLNGYALAFWLLFMGMGLLLPLVVEFMELVKENRVLALMGPVLVLLGGYVLRHVMVNLGQETAWQDYGYEYNPQLLERVKTNYPDGEIK
ncbi:MAG: polysulfide reductase NrfD [Chromatiales bacterium]|jgi:formate-dependent nitrite reductase membrane component NrfD